ncbi:hypothetical protein [Corynebacterium meridianum]|uniref:Uncharacterized protein n=1 Tax=Corynebacterium meridianum TaxID=2765363 RepID=A0A934M680_9CORY|nr:hypothetical protein [Corynebacterium meridianum]MBI8988162.1 hypothetical protein [Corynebacterium meridianum]
MKKITSRLPKFFRSDSDSPPKSKFAPYGVERRFREFDPEPDCYILTHDPHQRFDATNDERSVITLQRRTAPTLVYTDTLRAKDRLAGQQQRRIIHVVESDGDRFAVCPWIHQIQSQFNEQSAQEHRMLEALLSGIDEEIAKLDLNLIGTDAVIDEAKKDVETTIKAKPHSSAVTKAEAHEDPNLLADRRHAEHLRAIAYHENVLKKARDRQTRIISTIDMLKFRRQYFWRSLLDAVHAHHGYVEQRAGEFLAGARTTLSPDVTVVKMPEWATPEAIPAEPRTPHYDRFVNRLSKEISQNDDRHPYDTEEDPQ